MKRTSPCLALLHTDPVLHAQLRRACYRDFHVLLVQSWEELTATMRCAPVASVAVVDPYAENPPDGPAVAVKHLCQEFPSLVVIAAVSRNSTSMEDVLTLGQWGIAFLISLDQDMLPTRLASQLRSTRVVLLQRLLRHAFPTGMSFRAQEIVLQAVETASRGGSAADLATAFHVSTRTLLRECRRAELLPPRALLGWLRVLLASTLLGDPGRTVADVAHACGYYSDTTLRRAVGRTLCMHPNELREPDALHTALDSFTEQVLA